MAKFKIKKRYSNDIRLEGEAETFKGFIEKNKSNLRDSNLRDSNLRDSNLRDSNLSGSNLSGSDLSGSDLSGSNLRWVKIKANQKDELLKALKVEIIED